VTQESWTASSCQISSKPFKAWPKYGDFSIFQNGGRRRFGCLRNYEYLTAGRVIGVECQISWRSAKPLQFINLFLLCPNAVAAMQVTSLVLSTTRCQIGLPALVFQESLPRFMTRNLYRTDLAKSSSPDQWYFSYKNHFSLGFS